MWSYAYNILRVYSSKDSEGVNPDALTKDTKSAGETPENLSKCCAGPMLPLKECSPNEGHTDHFELVCTESKEKVKVV